jgi:hypothetical protein
LLEPSLRLGAFQSIGRKPQSLGLTRISEDALERRPPFGERFLDQALAFRVEVACRTG